MIATIGKGIALAFIAALYGTSGSGVMAAQTGCLARVTADVHAIEAPDAVMHKGPWTQITQVRISKTDGSISYCAHGDYCFPSGSIEIYTPCKIDTDIIPEPPNVEAVIDTWDHYTR